MPASTVYPAKVALLALLQAWVWPAGAEGQVPEVRWGYPTEAEDRPRSGELVAFGEVDLTATNQTLGATRNDENYSISIVIDVLRLGDDEQATEQRCWELYAALDDLLVQQQQSRTPFGSPLYRLTDRRARQRNVVASPSQWVSQIVVDQSVVGIVVH